MKRSPLKRKTSLRASYAAKLRAKGQFRPALTLSPLPKRKTRLRHASFKKARENRLYSKLRLEFLKEHPFCQVHTIRMIGGMEPSEDIHHSRGRGNKLLTDTRFFLATCRVCHDWIHANGKEARRLGLLASAKDWNVSP